MALNAPNIAPPLVPPSAPRTDLPTRGAAIKTLKSVGSATKKMSSATGFLFRMVNPMRLYQASAKVRMIVASSILGLGTAGGIATVMTPKDTKNIAPVIVPSNLAKQGGRSQQPVKPLLDTAPDAPLSPPPANVFSGGDRIPPRSIRGQTPAQQDFPANEQEPAPIANPDSQFPPRPKVIGTRSGPIQQVADASPAEISPVEPGRLSASVGDAGSSSYGPAASNFVEPAGGTEAPPTNPPPSNPPPVESTPPQEIPPPKPQLRNIGDGVGTLGTPNLAPPPNNFGQSGFGKPRDGGANDRFGPPPSQFPANNLPPNLPANNVPHNNFAPEASTSNPPPAVPATTFDSMRSRAGLGGDRFNGGTGLTSIVPADAVSLASPAPGAKQLEGLQTPSLALEKVAPPDVQVGKPATFQTKVRNVGQVTAHQVAVVDHVPAGARFAEATPQPVQSPDGTLTWKIGTLQPGDEAVITMQVIPEREGEIGSVAQLLFQSQASVRAVCTKPQLVLKHTAPQRVLIGETAMIAIAVTNNGTGIASGVILAENVPPQFTHPAGNELEYEIGSLRPGETKQITLALKAAKAGTSRNLITAGNETNVSSEDEIQIEVVAPQLEVGLNGPRVRYLERQATYTVSLTNPGTAPANNIELVAFLPRGFKFLSADKNGQYDSQNHAVFWSLEQLPPGVNGEVQLTALPIEVGEQKFRVQSRADLGLQKVFEQAVQVEGLSELQFSVADVADPIEVGSDTVYEIKLTNRGHKPATNVQIAIGFPPELQPVSGDGPSRVTVGGNQISIDPIAQLAPGAQALFKIQARGLRAGDPRIRVQLMSDESPNPVTKEESTRVYADK